MNQRLDDLLELWAEGSRLTPEEAVAVLAAVVDSPASEPAPGGLDLAWWQGVMGRLNGMVVQVATMPEAAQAAVRQALVPPLPAPG